MVPDEDFVLVDLQLLPAPWMEALFPFSYELLLGGRKPIKSCIFLFADMFGSFEPLDWYTQIFLNLV